MDDTTYKEFRVTYLEHTAWAFAEPTGVPIAGTERVVCDGLTLDEAHAVASMINQSRENGDG